MSNPSNLSVYILGLPFFSPTIPAEKLVLTPTVFIGSCVLNPMVVMSGRSALALTATVFILSILTVATEYFIKSLITV